MGIVKFIRMKSGNLLKNNRFLLIIFNNILKFLRLSKFNREQKKRILLSIFDYKELAAPIPFCPIENIREANFYGNVYMLRKYCDYYKGEFTMEHGLMYGDYLQKWYELNTVHKIITFSTRRQLLIQNKLRKESLAIGPYIHYCDSLLSDSEISELKDKYGKILLFIPVHSTSEGKNKYDIYNQIEKIYKIKKELFLDSVFVCMHHYDINHYKYHEIYEKAGFKIVTAGNGYDLNFIPRLKSIISIADFTLSNAVGTHTGYCIYLNKPHWIPWEINSNASPHDYARIAMVFRSCNLKITSDQWDIVSEYWGFNDIKSKKQIIDFLTEK